MENVFKELYSYNLKGVSLSIADAKVDTFQLLTKSYYNFFSRFFEEKSQSTDLQALHILGYFNIYGRIDKYMLQNIKNERFCNEMCMKTKTQENIEITFNRKKTSNITFARYFESIILTCTKLY
jgi:hypothetical protein